MNHSPDKIGEQIAVAENILTRSHMEPKSQRINRFPGKQMKRCDPEKSWITNRIKTHIADRDKLYQIWIKSKSNEDYEKYKKNEMYLIWKFEKQSEKI